jgi:hypothetical protein
MAIQSVTAKKMRELFSLYRIQERLARGEFSEDVLKETDAAPKYGQRKGTKSQLVAYREFGTGHMIAMVHQFVRPDGKLGASGKPDPKYLKIDGTIYKLAPKPTRKPR